MKKINRILTAALALCMTLSLTTFASAAATTTSTGKTPEVRVNGYLVNFPDEKPYIDANKRTLIPVRFVAEQLGATVKWDSTLRAAVISKDGTTLTIPIGSKDMSVVTGSQKSTVTMDTEAVLINQSRTMVPIRFVATALGAWVSYSSYYSTVQIYDDVLTADEITKLHSLSDSTELASWNKNIFAGTYCFENQSEYAIREFCKTKAGFVIKNSYDGTSYDSAKNDGQDCAALISKYICSSLSELYTRAQYGTTATFRTDTSCLFAGKDNDPQMAEVYRNRGYLTITFASNADVAGFKKNFDCAKFGDVQPGHTYTYIIESNWMPTNYGIMEVMEYDRTSGGYTSWGG